MSGIFKVILFSSPVIAIILYYIVTQQNKIDMELKMENIRFEKAWSEFESEFTKNSRKKETLTKKIEKLDELIEEFEKKQKEKELKTEEFEKEFEKAIKEFEEKKK